MYNIYSAFTAADHDRCRWTFLFYKYAKWIILYSSVVRSYQPCHRNDKFLRSIRRVQAVQHDYDCESHLWSIRDSSWFFQFRMHILQIIINNAMMPYIVNINMMGTNITNIMIFFFIKNKNIYILCYTCTRSKYDRIRQIKELFSCN